MTARSLPARSEIPTAQTWDVESVFPDHAAWKAEFKRVRAALPDIREFQGHLADGPDVIADFMHTSESLLSSLGKLVIYATMYSAVDSGDQRAIARQDRVRGLSAEFSSAISFAEPELIAIGVPQLLEWARANPRLKLYEHHFDRLGQRARHVRSEEVEEVLSLVSDPLATAASIHGTLANAELRFAAARGADGDQYEVAQGTYADLLTSPDREVRKTAWRNYADAHRAFSSTMAACLATGIKRDVFIARARHYSGSLEASLEANNIPVEVFHNVLEAFRDNLPTWHRYWRLRRRALGVEALHVYDVRAPLIGERIEVPYEQAVEWIAEGLRPMGEEYVSLMRRGSLHERWVDIYPNRGKRMGAFSIGSGVPDTKPFVFLSYNNNLFSLSTLAHELGHSMHSWYSKTRQPFVYAGYGLFVAEVASNFHQAMVRDHLLRTNASREFQVGVIEEAMTNFHRYFMVMPSLARFELEIHQRVERGAPLTADWMTARMADLLEEVYGGEVEYEEEADRARSGITWAEFHTHLYSNFYVYQYATGIAGAHWLADRVLRGEPGAADDYMRFISAGSSVYPLEALRMAGVDMSSPEPVKKAFAVMAGYVDRLEELLSD